MRLGRCGMKGTWCMRYGSLGGRRWAGGLGTGRHNGRPPPRGGQIILQHTHPHLLSTPVGRAAEGLLWSLIQLLLLLEGERRLAVLFELSNTHTTHTLLHSLHTPTLMSHPTHRRQLWSTHSKRSERQSSSLRRYASPSCAAARAQPLTARGGRPPPPGRAPPPPPAPPPAAPPRRSAATRKTATCEPTTSSRRTRSRRA